MFVTNMCAPAPMGRPGAWPINEGVVIDVTDLTQWQDPTGGWHRIVQRPEVRPWLRTPAERFWAKVALLEDGCWAWLASSDHGYGQFRVGGRKGRMIGAHVFAYTLLIGPIPAGLELDHLCGPSDQRVPRNRWCVNPAHLEAVTHAVNTLRSPVAPAAINSRKTHCVHGHAFDEANTHLRPDGRQCRACRRERERARRSLRS